MPALMRQTWTLVKKNLLIAVIRHPLTTTLRALIFPLTLVLVITYAQYFFNPSQHFGIGTPSPILSLADAVSQANPSRNTVVFVNNNMTDGDIMGVTDYLFNSLSKTRVGGSVISSRSELRDNCRTNKRGNSNCFGAVVFHSSPTQPKLGGVWNYTILMDSALGGSADVRKTNNDAQIYHLPLQQAVDHAITLQTPDYQGPDLSNVKQYLYTKDTEEKRATDRRQSYLASAVIFFGVIFVFAMIGVVYHLTGTIAYERECGLSSLIESMMPNNARWQPRAIRLLSYHASFTLIYLPSWLATGIILSVKVFTSTNAGIIIFYHLLTGLALCSYTLFGAVLFKRAQLSGVAMTVVAIILAVIPQVLGDPEQTMATVVALSLIFPSSNYTYFITYVARWEYFGLGAEFSQSAPESPWILQGQWLIVLLVIQILLYPVLAFFLERLLFSTTSPYRRLYSGEVASGVTVRLQSFSKTYKQSLLSRLFTKRKADVQAVKQLDLKASRGQILMLLGPNGSGKSTTLNSVAGLDKLSSGQIDLDGSGGLGIAPQKNVLWDVLTVREHVEIFHKLKASGSRNTNQELADLLDACDISEKASAKTKTLSGGQKRKVQLAIMFAGGSAVCCVDEVSSGLDPLSRRKIWDILLAQRSSRTIIMTTHFLDEADFLSDHIAILAKGTLKAEGSSAELKHRYGNGYTIDATGPDHFQNRRDIGHESSANNASQKSFNAADGVVAMELIEAMERNGVDDYRVCGPTLEDVFLKLVGTYPSGPAHSEETPPSSVPATGISEKRAKSHDMTVTEVSGVDLRDGRHLNAFQQAWVLFIKRLMVFRRKWGPHLSAIIVALIGAGVSLLFLEWFEPMVCQTYDPYESYSTYRNVDKDLGYAYGQQLVAGPPSARLDDTVKSLSNIYGPKFSSSQGRYDDFYLRGQIRSVDSLQAFDAFVEDHMADLTPGGFWLGDLSSSPTFAWQFDGIVAANPILVQNILNNYLTNITISAKFDNFETPSEGMVYSYEGILYVIYFSLIFCLYPAFYALYPTVERTRQARALQYSNGVRTAPMWLAYLVFDLSHVLVISVVAITMMATISPHLRHAGHPAYLFIVLLLYGTSSTILSYIISMFARSQLAAWALCASGQVVMCLAYFGAYLGVQSNTAVADLQSSLNKVQYSMGLFSPIANVQRSLFVALNQFLIACGKQKSPGALEMYGSPILYLVIQCFLLFGLLLLWDSGFSIRKLRRKIMKSADAEDKITSTQETSKALARIQSATSGLGVMHLSKSFGKNKAVDDVSFGINQSEVFTLLGPNGAGKSTAISLIRGDIEPSGTDSSIRVDDLSLFSHRAKARARLGVCPQFDATDVLTVQEHLRFYTRVRGVPNPAHNVEQLIHACGLEQYRHQLASKLSGGTKRKLSLAIAMAGNPSVLLLDEPSSGLDAASKRTMWHTLSSISPGRSILLTTHSMEEADALADRAAIMSSSILAQGTCAELRRRWGDVYHVHLVTKTAPYTSANEMEYLKQWVRDHLQGVRMNEKTYCGQLRFSVPARVGGQVGGSAVGELFRLLESKKEELGVEFYSIGETTLDQVFVNVIREHGGEEEGSRNVPKRRWWQRRLA